MHVCPCKDYNQPGTAQVSAPLIIQERTVVKIFSYHTVQKHSKGWLPLRLENSFFNCKHQKNQNFCFKKVITTVVYFQRNALTKNKE